MTTIKSFKNILEDVNQPLNIIEEYAALSPKRKYVLCDQLFIEGKRQFMNTVKVLWPEATDHDIYKLEKFLVLLRSTKTGSSHQTTIH